MIVRLVKTYEHYPVDGGPVLMMQPGQLIDADGDELAELLESGVAVPHRVDQAREQR